MERAVRQRWALTDEQKSKLVEKAARIVATSKKPREVIAAGKLLVAIESQNQKDEHLEANELRNRIIELAVKFGVDVAAIESRPAGQNPDSAGTTAGDGDAE